MDLKTRTRHLHEQADTATSEASARWDGLVQARTALEALDEADVAGTPELAAAQAAQGTYNAAADAARGADRAYLDVLELMGTEAPEGHDPRVARSQPAGEAPSASIGEQFAASDVFKNIAARIPDTPGSKLSIGTTESVEVANREQARAILRGRNPQAAIFSTPSTVVEPDVKPGIHPLPLLPPLTVLDLITMATTDSTAVKWVRESAFTNAAAEVAESTQTTQVTKPESALTLATVTFPVTTIAHWMPASKQSLRDVAGVKSLIDTKLEWGLRRRLATQVMVGDGAGANLRGIVNTTGIGHIVRPATFNAQTFTEAIWDGAAVINQAYGETPNVCFVTWADYKILRFSRNNEGGAGTGSYTFGPPTSRNPIEIENTLVLPNFDLAAGKSILGIWREFAVWMHEGITIGMSDSHADYYIKNLVAILAEFACAAGAMETVAFCDIT